MELRLYDIVLQRGLNIEGEIEGTASEESLAQCLLALSEAARATAVDGQARDVSAPGGTLRVSKEIAEQGSSLMVKGPLIPSKTWVLLLRALKDKNKQVARAPAPAWVRLEDLSGASQYMPLPAMTLELRARYVAEVLRNYLAGYSNIAGIIFTPQVSFSDVEAGQQADIIDLLPGHEALLVRSRFPAHRMWESLIVAREGGDAAGCAALAECYTGQATWLDWALAQLGWPSFDMLVTDMHDSC